MRSERKRRRHAYAALKRTIFLRILLAAVCAVAAVFACRRLTLGKLGDLIVHTFSETFRIDRQAAFHLYQFGIRNYLEVLFAVAVIAFLVIGFRLLLHTIEQYFNEIADGIDRLTGDPDVEIRLSPELGFMENRLLKVQQTLARKERQSRQTEQRKDDLVIYAAHDIRTPLTSVLGYLILLDGNPDLPPEERRKYIGITLAKTRELDRMIDEFFEITRYHLHDVTLEKTWIDLYSMLLQMKEEQAPMLRSGHRQLWLHMEETTAVYADPEKLARAFQNLLKNAIAYSDPDSAIEISAQTTGAATTILFKNRCRPIPQEQLDRIFAPFYRLEERRPNNSAGAGLGLAIAQQLILLHGGAITATNEAQGICFAVRLPAPVPEK